MRPTFAEATRQILVVEKKYPMALTAQAMGMEYATLYSRVTGRTPFRPEEINSLLIEAPDVRLIDALLQDTVYVAVERPTANGWGDAREIMSASLQSVQEVLKAVMVMNSAADKARWSEGDRSRIEAHIQEAESSLARVRLGLPHHLVTYGPHAA